MARTISWGELSEDTSNILRAVEAGESFILTRDGVPFAQLAPLESRGVPRDEVLRVFRSAPPIDAARFRADIDEGFDQSIEPRT